MHKDELPYWLQSLTIRFREDNEDKGDEGEGDDSGDNGEEDEDEGEGGDTGDNSGDDPEARIAALEKALSDERKLRRKIERDAKRNARKKSSEKKETDDAELQQQLQESAKRTERLAEGLRRKEVETAVLREARKQGFIDETDALVDDVLREIDVDQDEEDPTDIDIDQDSVVDAVKDLARRKKHLVGKGTPGEPSGGKFRRRGNSDDKPNDQALQEHYPSLR